VRRSAAESAAHLIAWSSDPNAGGGISAISFVQSLIALSDGTARERQTLVWACTGLAQHDRGVPLLLPALPRSPCHVTTLPRHHAAPSPAAFVQNVMRPALEKIAKVGLRLAPAAGPACARRRHAPGHEPLRRVPRAGLRLAPGLSQADEGVSSERSLVRNDVSALLQVLSGGGEVPAPPSRPLQAPIAGIRPALLAAQASGRGHATPRTRMTRARSRPLATQVRRSRNWLCRSRRCYAGETGHRHAA